MASWVQPADGPEFSLLPLGKRFCRMAVDRSFSPPFTIRHHATLSYYPEAWWSFAIQGNDAWPDN
uniref:Uncharacterized protein n=1 Tax=Bionectria ochroleuca TaxID=29856 RepID=A0A0B7JM61_BIOOC